MQPGVKNIRNSLSARAYADTLCRIMAQGDRKPIRQGGCEPGGFTMLLMVAGTLEKGDDGQPYPYFCLKNLGS